MALQVEHSFQVEAPIEQVWAYFANPPQVVSCLPGAELLEVLDEGRYLGAVGLRIGSIAAQFKGTADITEMDAEAYRMTVKATGNQQGTPGRVEADIRFALTGQSDVLTTVLIMADMGISGKLAQVGGGMIQSVSKFLFDRFAKCVQHAITCG